MPAAHREQVEGSVPRSPSLSVRSFKKQAPSTTYADKFSAVRRQRQVNEGSPSPVDPGLRSKPGRARGRARPQAGATQTQREAAVQAGWGEGPGARAAVLSEPRGAQHSVWGRHQGAGAGARRPC